MSYNQEVKYSREIIKLPNLLPFLGIAMKEPRLPPITLWGLRNGGFLKDPVYWWRKECILWDVGGLPFFTIGSVVRNIQKSFHRQPEIQDHMRRIGKAKQKTKQNAVTEIILYLALLFWLSDINPKIKMISMKKIYSK